MMTASGKLDRMMWSRLLFFWYEQSARVNIAFLCLFHTQVYWYGTVPGMVPVFCFFLSTVRRTVLRTRTVLPGKS
jgi:hypothetical protein